MSKRKLNRKPLTGEREVNAKKWRSLWSTVCTYCDAISIESRDVTDLEAEFETEEEADSACDRLMAAGFAASSSGSVVFGFPEIIQDDTTGEPTRLSGLDTLGDRGDTTSTGYIRR